MLQDIRRYKLGKSGSKFRHVGGIKNGQKDSTSFMDDPMGMKRPYTLNKKFFSSSTTFFSSLIATNCEKKKGWPVCALLHKLAEIGW